MMKVENFPNMGKETVIQVQKMQRVPYGIDPKRNTKTYINQTNKKYKEKILKSNKRKANHKQADGPMRPSADFFSQNSAGQQGVAIYI